MARLIEVTWHALEMWQGRWPSQLDREQIRQLIATEVDDALCEGRYSSRLPRFAMRPGSSNRTLKRNGEERDRTLRLVWTPDQERCYLIDRRGEMIHVVTSIRPTDSPSA